MPNITLPVTPVKIRISYVDYASDILVGPYHRQVVDGCLVFTRIEDLKVTEEFLVPLTAFRNIEIEVLEVSS